jgi:hypothetical protein
MAEDKEIIWGTIFRTEDGEFERLEIDFDKFAAAGLAGDPTVRAIMLEAAQEIFETTGKVLPGVEIGVRITLEDDALVPFALDGDWEPLASYIEKGGDINNDMRKFIVDVLKGKVRRPKGSPPRAKTLLHHAEIAWHVRKWRTQGLGPEAAIEKVMEKFNIDRRTVQRALKDCPD